MTEFKQGDRVKLTYGKGSEGVVIRVGSTCLYCTDDDGNQFNSHIENFVSVPLPIYHAGDLITFGTDDAFGGTVIKDYSDRFGNWIVYQSDRGTLKGHKCVVSSDQRFTIHPVIPVTILEPVVEEKVLDRKPIIIGFAGKKGSGKDTAAQALEGYENIKMAGAFKEMIRAFMRYVGICDETIERCIEGDMKETPLQCWGWRSTRFVAQTLGTDWGRDLVWHDIWINAFKIRASRYDKVKCTDVRYPNEVDAIHKDGGLVVGIYNSLIEAIDTHASESHIDSLNVDARICNDGTVPQLHDKVHRTVNHLTHDL